MNELLFFIHLNILCLTVSGFNVLADARTMSVHAASQIPLRKSQERYNKWLEASNYYS